jgi:deazaflavin-dependent oxidoreductase (nitroreductase family)
MVTHTVGTPADHKPAVRTIPRFALRTFWLLHRAAYRSTGGRFGLSRPEAGERFGMMRLTTLGRRSGATRVAIVGYYEDEANLVTLAMNGWGRSEPAWWLNLQANPDATVELPSGPRAVRARAASGEERDRLWARFRDYPGWAPDIDASAALRPTPTAVIVLEPRDARAETSAPATNIRADVPADVPATIIETVPTAEAHQPRRLELRHLWIVPGLGIALFANAQSSAYGAGLVPLLLFGIAPHLPALAGIGQRLDRGQLAPRAVPLFNAMHQPALPLVLAALAATGILSPFWLVGALAWLSHIVVDWGFAKGLRTRDGYVRGSSPPKCRSIAAESDPRVPLAGSLTTANVVLSRRAFGDRH